LYDDLTKTFRKKNVFIDIDTIKGGSEFIKIIEQTINSCDVLVAIIGTGWLIVTQDGVRRLDDPKDFVRREIAAAFKQEIVVIPVLIPGANVPREEDLPDELKPIAGRHAVQLSDNRWKYDVEQLVSQIKQIEPRQVTGFRRIISRQRIALTLTCIIVLALGIFFAIQRLSTPAPIVTNPLRASQTPDTAATAASARSRRRPISSGLSIGGRDIDSKTFGTIGLFVMDDRRNRYILGTAHTFGKPGDIGKEVLQPSPVDGGKLPDDVIGLYAAYVPLKDGGSVANMAGLVKLNPQIEFDPSVPGIGSIVGIREASAGAKVRKFGRSSGITTGVVTGINESVTLTSPFSLTPVRLNGVIQCTPLAEAGDSGALVVDSEGYAIGIIVAGSQKETLVAPIQPILDTLSEHLGLHLSLAKN
jgi:hypothetical protein